jgi:succinate-acetate transporter protein
MVSMAQKKEPNITEQKDVMSTEVTVKTIPVADPAPLGLIGLAVAALVLGAVDLQLIASVPSKSLMIPWILFFGATAQLIAGGMEFKRNNIFGATVFSVYAMTMYSIALTLSINNSSVLNPGNLGHYAYGLVGILLFSLIATVASLMTNKALFAILIAVDLSVALLIPHYLLEMSSQPAGVFLILTSMLSFYTAAAIVLNTMAGRTVLPLGKPLWTPKK